MNAIAAEHFARVTLGPAQTHRHIAVVPLLGPDAGPAPYLTLSEALAGRCLTVTEVSEGGSVPELKVISQSDRPILLLDGEELVGASRTVSSTPPSCSSPTPKPASRSVASSKAAGPMPPPPSLPPAW